MLLLFHLRNIAEQIGHSYGHHYGCRGLRVLQAGSLGGVAGQTHQQREDRAAEEAHDHQSAHLVLLLGSRDHGLGEDDREDVAIAVAHQCDRGPEHPLLRGEHEARHGHAHHQDDNGEEGADVDSAHEDGSREAAEGAEGEVDARSVLKLAERVARGAQALQENLRRHGVGAHVNAHMTHDGYEGKQDDGRAEHPHAGQYARGLVLGGFLLDGGHAEPQRGGHADEEEEQEEDTPAQAEGRRRGRGAPCRDERGDKRGDGLDKLTEGERGGQVALDQDRHERIERGLHDGVADAQQREGDVHQPELALLGRHETVEEGKEYGQRRDDDGEEHRLLTANLIHQHARGHGEDEKPEEYERGEEIGS